MKFEFGDPIWFRQRRGGYGWPQTHIPGTFVREHASRVSILIRTFDDSRDVQIVVHPKNVTPRK